MGEYSIMDERKEQQIALDVDGQIDNLKAIGLIINDENYAREILNDISYFRLIKAFSLGLKFKNSNYDREITFEKIVNLYLFNSNFRQLLFPEIEKIEINLRCRVSNYFSCKFGVLGYKKSENFLNQEFHKIFLDDIEFEIERNKKAPFVKNFKDNYIDGEIPFYAIIELFSFGMLSKFFKNMKNEDKKAVAKTFSVGYTYFESWIESISYVRNICAHYGRIYNAKLSKTPILYSQYSNIGIRNNRIFSVLLCMKILLGKNIHWVLFVQNLVALIEKYDSINIETMGFPDNWENLLLEETVN